MIEISNRTNFNIDKVALKKLAEKVLKKEKRAGENLSLALLGAQRMHTLNYRYRGRKSAANVLAFDGGNFALGEIVLCPSVIRKDAVEYKIPFKGAISWMFVHGLLHLLGYDHKSAKDERIMTQKEQQYLS